MTTGDRTELERVRTRVASGLAEHLPKHLARLHWSADQLAQSQRDQLRTLLARAKSHSPFHSHRLRDVDADNFELDDIAQLPIMTKAQMMEGFADVVTDRRVSRPLVEAHLREWSHEPHLLLDKYVCLASGGSSGVRSIIVQTVDEYTDMGAGLLRRGVAQAAAPGQAVSGGVVIAMVAAASPVHATGFGAATARSGPVRFESVPATLPLHELVERLNAVQPSILMGYPSTLARLASEQQAGRLRIAPRSVTSSSETLGVEDRARITAGFGVPVVNQFGSTEGLLGHSEPGDDVLTFASDLCIAELVDDDHRPVPDGTPSTKVLVTNLHNLTQPLIRYELTDSFIRRPDGENPGLLRATVAGRVDDALRFGRVEVHPHVLRSELVKSPTISEYQVRQTPSGVDVDVITDGPIDPDAIAASLEQVLRAAGLDNPKAEVRTVDALTRHTQTGKTRRFIPYDESSTVTP